jgi:hypothetical protein
MAASKNVQVGPQARPPARTQPAHAKRPGTASVFPAGSPKKPPVTGKGRI